MPNLLLIGQANCGKTTILNQFYDDVGQRYIDEKGDSVVPLVMIEGPSGPDEKGLYTEILTRFHTPFRMSDTALKLQYQVMHLFRICQVKMLIIDEFHSMMTGSTIKQRQIMVILKRLCNVLMIPIVGVGTIEAANALRHDEQHASRFQVHRLPKWEPDKEFQQFLAGYEMVLPLKHPSGISRREMAETIHAISKGNTGNVYALLSASVKTAIESGEEKITKEILLKNKCVQPTSGIAASAVAASTAGK